MAERPREDHEDVPFEALLERLGDVVSRLESGDLPLDRALAVFEEGVGLARAGSKRLDDAERRVEQLLADGDSVTTRPLSSKESVE